MLMKCPLGKTGKEAPQSGKIKNLLRCDLLWLKTNTNKLHDCDIISYIMSNALRKPVK